jgi:hypothetical protein
MTKSKRPALTTLAFFFYGDRKREVERAPVFPLKRPGHMSRGRPATTNEREEGPAG